MAKAGRTFVPTQADDSHTNITFNKEKDRIEGRWIDTPNGKVMLVLRMIDVCYLWIDEKGATIQTVSTAKKHIREIEEQLIIGIEKMGLNSEGFTDTLHFEIPEYSFMKQPVQLLSMHAINEWKKWRGIANEACELLLHDLNKESEIRIWPHHFDTGIFVEISEDYGVGFGLAIKDEMVGAPYFYASCYLSERHAVYENMPDLNKGRWIVDGWMGAVLSLQDLKKESDPMVLIKEFTDTTMPWYMGQS